MNETRLRGAVDLAAQRAAREIMAQQGSAADRTYTMQCAQLALGVAASRDKLLDERYATARTQHIVNQADKILEVVLDGIKFSNDEPEQAEQAPTE